MASQIGFERLVKEQLIAMKDPSLKCVNLVDDELKSFVAKCGNEMKEFPMFRQCIEKMVIGFIDSHVHQTKLFVTTFIEIQQAFINTEHPEFNDISGTIKNLMDTDKKNIDIDALSEIIFRIFPNSKYLFSLLKSIRTLKFLLSEQNKENLPNLDSGNFDAVQANIYSMSIHFLYNAFGNFFSENMVSGYFEITRKSVQDTVSKAIMKLLVHDVADNLFTELIEKLYKADDTDELLVESEDMINRRKDAAETLEALKKVNDVISEIRETHLQ